jgi:predicted O-methyltransferase YrrM
MTRKCYSWWKDGAKLEQITGVEMSPDMVTVAREVVERAGLADRIRFLVGDAGDKSVFGSLGQFDLIYSTFSLHHWKDPKRVIRNLDVCAGG